MDDNSDMRFYRDRWEAVEKIERQELRAMSVEQHWQQLNLIARLGSALQLEQEDEESKMQVFLRWARLKGGTK